MAVSGSATSAYRYKLSDGVVRITPTSCLRSLCDKPSVALVKILAGDTATVASGEAAEMRRLLAENGKEVRA